MKAFSFLTFSKCPQISTFSTLSIFSTVHFVFQRKEQKNFHNFWLVKYIQDTETQLITKLNIILKINIPTVLWRKVVLSESEVAEVWVQQRSFFPVALHIYFWKWEKVENAEERAGRKRAGDDGGRRNQGDGRWGSWGPSSGKGRGRERPRWFSRRKGVGSHVLSKSSTL